MKILATVPITKGCVSPFRRTSLMVNRNVAPMERRSGRDLAMGAQGSVSAGDFMALSAMHIRKT